MLSSLAIRDVVLIGRLDLAFKPGLCVLTGETGAGKSILLDALGLALGGRAETRLIRHGAAGAQVTAEFQLPPGHPALAVLAEHGIDEGDNDGHLILRRSLNPDGRSRAFVNDQAVSAGLLRRLGQTLVEVHGQFDSQRLLDPSSHRTTLDSYGGLQGLAAKTAASHRRWSVATEALAEAERNREAARRDEEYLRHAAGELSALDPRVGEETELAEKRALMMHGEKLLEAMNAAAGELAQGRGVEGALRAASRHLESAATRAGGQFKAMFEGVLQALDRAALEADEASVRLEKVAGGMDSDTQSLEAAEERLFALRALSRKHNTPPDDLPGLLEHMSAQLAALEDGRGEVARLKAAATAARQAYRTIAQRLGDGRRRAAVRLDKVVAGELEPLKLGQARFATLVEALEEKDWGEAGWDRVVFQVTTNPGTPPGPLHRIVSGGELARFMLALKAVLAQADTVPTIIFDEVDSGVGGAVAAAVGERLARLGGDLQVLVVTHSPQVAALGVHHLRVSKADRAGEGMRTTVAALSAKERKEEIGRMLAGATVTDEARAAAGSLLEGQGP